MVIQIYQILKMEIGRSLSQTHSGVQHSHPSLNNIDIHYLFQTQLIYKFNLILQNDYFITIIFHSGEPNML